jgi:aminoglycoside phosphotransferase (APT) family kinase protein
VSYSITHWTYYLAFSLFRLAAIAQGVYKRHLDGTAASPDAVKSRDAARERAELAWSLVS